MSTYGKDETGSPKRRQVKDTVALLLAGLVLTSLAAHWLVPTTDSAGLASLPGATLIVVGLVEATLLWHLTWLSLAWLSTLASPSSKAGSVLKAAINSLAPKSAKRLAARTLVSTTLAGSMTLGLGAVALAEPPDPLLFPGATVEESTGVPVDDEEALWPASPEIPEAAEEPAPEEAEPETEEDLALEPGIAPAEEPLPPPATQEPATPEPLSAAQPPRASASTHHSRDTDLQPLTAPQLAKRYLRQSLRPGGLRLEVVEGKAFDQAHTVVPGDCLWDIAKHLLGEDATDQEIDDLWRRIYALNQDLIGDDPDLIEPDQILLLPEGPLSESAGHDERAAA